MAAVSSMMMDLEPGTRVKTYRTDRDTAQEYWDTLGVVRWRDHSDKYESYIVAWDCGAYETSMMRDELEVLTEDEARLALAREVMRT